MPSESEKGFLESDDACWIIVFLKDYNLREVFDTCETRHINTTSRFMISGSSSSVARRQASGTNLLPSMLIISPPVISSSFNVSAARPERVWAMYLNTDGAMRTSSALNFEV